MALDGINDSVINGVSDIENMITTVINVYKMQINNASERRNMLKNKLIVEDYYTETQYTVCEKYLI